MKIRHFRRHKVNCPAGARAGPLGGASEMTLPMGEGVTFRKKTNPFHHAIFLEKAACRFFDTLRGGQIRFSALCTSNPAPQNKEESPRRGTNAMPWPKVLPPFTDYSLSAKGGRYFLPPRLAKRSRKAVLTLHPPQNQGGSKQEKNQAVGSVLRKALRSFRPCGLYRQ